MKTGQKAVGPLLVVVALGSACGKSSSNFFDGIGGRDSAGASAGATAGTTQGTTGGARATGGMPNGGAPAGGAPTAGVPGTGGTGAGTAGAVPNGGTPSAGTAGDGGATSGQAGRMALGGAPAAGHGGTGAGGESAASGTLGEAGAPSGGAGGARSELGFDCGTVRCEKGQVCVKCPMGSPIDRTTRCVPHPVDDRAGFNEAVGECLSEPTTYEECDGPEDCESGEYCVAASGPEGVSRCRATPATGFETCCFYCNALLNCTLCRTSADCPAEDSECAPVLMGPAGLLGCQ